MYEPMDILNIYKAVKGQKAVNSLSRLKPDSYKNIVDLTNRFNTRWSNIDPTTYMSCGTELWKGFSYDKFLDVKILQRYIKRDKAIKRKMFDSKEHILKSFSFIKSKGYKTLKEYGSTYSSGTSVCQPVLDNFNNHIDPVTTGYMLRNGLMRPNDVEMRYIGYMESDKKNMNQLIKTYTRLIKKLEKEL